jgi:hypothetical protein
MAYPQSEMGARRAEPQPIIERLKTRRGQLAAEMAKVDELLELLELNPGIEKFVNLMGGVNA